MIFSSNEQYQSRRSCVFSAGGMTASSQPLASLAGRTILDVGGSAADAAVAMAAALQVTQPCSTGLGGDAFCLYFEQESGKLHALNGSGRSPAALTLATARAAGFSGRFPPLHPHTITVPGAPAAWVDTHSRFGRLPLPAVLAPAVRLADEGFPAAPLTSLWWQRGAEKQLSLWRWGHELTIDGKGPRPGQIFRNPGLARTLQILAEQGSAPFYTGEMARAIVEEIRHEGGLMTMADLAAHRSEWVEPLSRDYRDCTVWECPPNGQGLAALIALGILNTRPHDADPDCRLHHRIQAMRQGFADALRWVCDPGFHAIPVEELLSDAYAAERAGVLREDKVVIPEAGQFDLSSSTGTDTVYFCAVDKEGNACSFINSNYMGFGTGMVPRGCGFTLQNRGHGFLLEPDHFNSLEPGKRPFHTIIPGMLTRKICGRHQWYAAFGVMGGMMQPQGHLQVVSALADENLDPQAALDAPRFQLDDGAPDGTVLLESPLFADSAAHLKGLGHSVAEVGGVMRYTFGLGQIIMRGDEGSLAGGSDPRGDGCALPCC